MTEFSVDETTARLRSSLATVQWAVAQVPAKWTHVIPDYYPPDAWSVAMNLAHMCVYEEGIAAPMLAALAAGGDGTGAIKSAREEFLTGATELSKAPVVDILRRLTVCREEQIAVLEGYDQGRFNEPVTSAWATGQHGSAPHSAGWVATKTFQHTWEHGNAILRMALFAPP